MGGKRARFPPRWPMAKRRPRPSAAEKSREPGRAPPGNGGGGAGNRCGLQQPNTPPSPPVSERASRPRVSKMIPWTPNDFLVTTIFITDAQSSEGSLRHSRFTLDLSGDVTGHRCCVCLQSAQLPTSRGNFPTTTQTFQMDSDSTRWRPDYRFCKSANGPMLFLVVVESAIEKVLFNPSNGHFGGCVELATAWCQPQFISKP